MHVLLRRELPGKRFIVHRSYRPQVKPGIRKINIHNFPEDGDHCLKFGAVRCTILPNVVFVAPGGDARQLIVDRHGAAVIGAVALERGE